MKHRKAAPQLVRHSVFETQQLLALTFLREGRAEPGHFNRMLDMIDMLVLGVHNRKPVDENVAKLCQLAREQLHDAYKAFKDGKPLELQPEAIDLLELVHSTSNDFWRRQASTFFDAARRALPTYYQGEKK